MARFMPDFEPTLTVPGCWITDYCRNNAPDLYRTRTLHDLGFTVLLSWNPDGRGAQDLVREGIEIGKVALDLSEGFSLTRKLNRTVELWGRSYYVQAVGGKGSRTGRPILCVTDVGRISEPRAPSAKLSSKISFVSMNEEAECDIRQLETAWSSALRWPSLQEDARKNAELQATKLLAEGAKDSVLQEFSDAHRTLKRQYGCLQQVLRLLRSRTEHEGAAYAKGKIAVDTANGDLTDEFATNASLVPSLLVPDFREGTFREGDLVELFLAGSPGNSAKTRVLSISVEGIHLDIQDRVPLAVGDDVEVRRIPAFPLWAHDRALNRLFGQDVPGSWRYLAALLSRPSSLEPPGNATPVRLFSDLDHERDPERFKPLNSDQREAVEGALSTPHAFLIQGPPGTGKTTVITEIVRQLTARGERVLLVAPTHVAVDEVLVRIARNQDHVFPVRLSYDDSRISREEIRKFSEDEVRSNLRNRIFSSKASKTHGWQRTRADAQAVFDAIEAWQAACARQDMAQTKALDAENTLCDLVTEADRELGKLAKEIEGNERARTSLRRDLAALQSTLELRRAELQQVKANSTWWDRVQDIAGFGPIGRADAQCRIAERLVADNESAMAELDKVLPDLRRTLQRRKRHWPKEIALSTRKLEAFKEDLADATRSVLTTLDAARDVTSSENEALFAPTLKKAVDTIARMEGLIRLEARWLEITQRNTSNPDADAPAGGRIAEELLQLINLACGTTVGIASRKLIADWDFDTLIIDEASRVTDGEFVIGAVKAKRWILVGDEHQLPPYVDQGDEYFLHALASIYSHEIAGGDLESHVRQLGAMWREDEELHQFREHSVLGAAQAMLQSGAWQNVYRGQFIEAVRYFENSASPQQEMLNTIRLYLVRSLFERCVSPTEGVRSDLKVRLKIQRRMIEPIAKLVSEPVYGGDYLSPAPEELAESGITPLTLPVFKRPVIFMDTSKRGVAASEISLDSEEFGAYLKRTGLPRSLLGLSGFINPLEADWISNVCILLDEAAYGENKDLSVSILCFYKAQSRLIQHKLAHHHMRRVRFAVIDAIDRIQGQESDVVLMSFCRSQPNRGRASSAFGRWLKDYRRLNVASTRAHRSLIMVGNITTLEKLTFSEEEVRARAFYENLWSLVDPHNKGHAHPAMGTLHDFKVSPRTS